jgi:hypothetical protein
MRGCQCVAVNHRVYKNNNLFRRYLVSSDLNFFELKGVEDGFLQ